MSGRTRAVGGRALRPEISQNVSRAAPSYACGIRRRTGGKAGRVRDGGASVDSSTCAGQQGRWDSNAKRLRESGD
eukprot:6210122-Pleurochrysis_carterae.AAC.2